MLKIAMRLIAACLVFLSLPGGHLLAQYGDGSDGPLTVTPGPTVFYSPTRTNLTAPAAASDTGLTVANASAFTPGMEVMLVGVHGANSGNWETATVLSAGGTAITLTAPLAKDYDGEAVVVQVRHYSSVDIPVGATLEVSSSRSVLAFRCNGAVNIGGTLTASRRGYRANGLAVEGGVPGDSHTYDPTFGSHSTAANGGGGGGGEAAPASLPNDDHGAGGGGGGYGTAGQPGIDVGSGVAGGQGGGTYGDPMLTRMYFGSAGGQGGFVCPQSIFCSLTNEGEGAGGGIVWISAPVIDLGTSGAITSDGEEGAEVYNDPIDGGVGGGGGGAGGTIWIPGAVLLGSGTATISARGGAGGANPGTPTALWGDGGDGGDGRIRIDSSYSTSIQYHPTPTFTAGVANATNWTAYE